jgi:hypothetical protein
MKTVPAGCPARSQPSSERKAGATDVHLGVELIGNPLTRGGSVFVKVRVGSSFPLTASSFCWTRASPAQGARTGQAPPFSSVMLTTITIAARATYVTPPLRVEPASRRSPTTCGVADLLKEHDVVGFANEVGHRRVVAMVVAWGSPPPSGRRLAPALVVVDGTEQLDVELVGQHVEPIGLPRREVLDRPAA